MIDEKIISVTNLETGEVFDTNLKLHDNKFQIRGHKMYNSGIIGLIDVLTKEECKLIINSFDSDNVDYCNIYIKPFSEITIEMDKASRSRLKKKLIENRIMLDYNKKLMLNPYTFIPRGDKNIFNCNYLTQQVWKYLVEDCNNYSEQMEKHRRHMFEK